MRKQKSAYEKFIEKPEARRLFEQERLLIEAAELVTAAMGERNVTRAQLAQRLGKSRAFITQVLRGNHNMTLRTLSDLFLAIDYQVSLGAAPYKEQARLVPQASWIIGAECWETMVQANAQASTAQVLILEPKVGRRHGMRPVAELLATPAFAA